MPRPVLCLCSLLSVLLPGSPLAFAAPIEVKTTHPARGDIVRYVTVPGTIKPNQQATLYAKVGGYLKSISVDKGSPVAAGQVIAEIEVPELVADLARTRAEVAVATTELSRLEGAAAKSPDLITPLMLDTARGRAEIARANQLRAETLLGFAKVTAPFAGIITARFVDEGAFIPAATASSSPQNSSLVTVSDFRTVRASVALPEIEAARAQVGQPVRVSVEGVTGSAFEARISRLSYALDDATRTMVVEADLPNPGLAFRPGMYAMIKVGVEKHTDALLIPAEALVMEKTNAFTFVAADGKARKTAIKIGFNDGNRVEVLTGLDPDANVILLGKLGLVDAQPVTAAEAK